MIYLTIIVSVGIFSLTAYLIADKFCKAKIKDYEKCNTYLDKVFEMFKENEYLFSSNYGLNHDKDAKVPETVEIQKNILGE